MVEQNTDENAPTTSPQLPTARRWLRRVARTIVASVMAYVLLVIVGLIPVNNDFSELREQDGITIYVTSDDIHADVILPLVSEEFDWRDEFPANHFAGATDGFSYIAVGWGDRGFYLDTPEWKDLKLSTAVTAMLLPSESVMHVQLIVPRENELCRSVTISREAYRRLTQFILASFRTNAQSRKRIDAAFHQWDAFYEARGHYHIFNTCNCWVGEALKDCGVRVPWFAPMPKTVLWYLPE